MTETRGPASGLDIKGLLGREWVYTAPEGMGRASIRKYALAIGDDNPLYYDQEYASKTRYGGIIAPPTMVCETWHHMGGELAESGAPANRPVLEFGAEIRGGNEYTFLRPLRPEDVLTAHWKVSDIREREGKTGKLIILQYEMTYTNQKMYTLAVHKETTLFRVSDSPQDGGDHPLTAEEAPSDIVPEVLPRRLDSTLYFEEVEVGDEITPLRKGIDLTRMVFYAAATWDFHRYHYDDDYARRLGFPRAFVDGQMLGAYLAQMLSDWSGDPGAIGKLGFRYKGFAFPGDVLTCKGRVTGKSDDDSNPLIDCELWIDNQVGETVLSPGHATLTLPLKWGVGD